MKYIIGNWKSNKNIREVNSWLESFTSHDLSIFKTQIQLVIAPSYPFIVPVKDALNKYPWIKVGSQDISQFGSGTYTGAVCSHNLDGLVEYAIVGHSERRKHFGETNATVDSKVQLAKSSDIEPIVCIRGKEDIIPDGAKIIAYEPPNAISTGSGEGETASLESVIQMKHDLSLSKGQLFIYGGSVNSSNIREFMQSDEIDGVLLGGVSLDAKKLYEVGEITFSVTE